jgi:hypothetical protein
MELDAGDLEFWLERAGEVNERERKRHGR